MVLTATVMLSLPRKICCLIGYESFGNHSFGVHGCECEVDSQWIVQLQRDCRIFVRNRWTLELENVII